MVRLVLSRSSESEETHQHQLLTGPEPHQSGLVLLKPSWPFETLLVLGQCTVSQPEVSQAKQEVEFEWSVMTSCL